MAASNFSPAVASRRVESADKLLVPKVFGDDKELGGNPERAEIAKKN
jgi:hypothetical protein